MWQLNMVPYIFIYELDNSEGRTGKGKRGPGERNRGGNEPRQQEAARTSIRDASAFEWQHQKEDGS